MATGFYIPDGRDFSSIFTAGNAGFTSGFKQANGQDLGNIFQAGNLNLATGYKISNNTDMGNKLGVTVAWSNNANTCQVLTKEGGTEVTNTILKNAALGIYSNYVSTGARFFIKFYRTITLTSVQLVFSTGYDEANVITKPANKDIIIMTQTNWTGSIQNCTGLLVRFSGSYSEGAESYMKCTFNQFKASGYYTV